MTKNEARKIGGNKGIQSSVAGLIIGYSIMGLFMLPDGLVNAFCWIVDVDYKAYLLAGAVIMMISSYLWGQFAGIAILINQKNHFVTGMLCGLGALMTAAFFSGLPGFLFQGMPWKYSIYEGFDSYIVKPFIWIMFFGFIPALVVGAWMGRSISNYRRS